MSSLAKRASPPQRLVMRIVAGAVRNAAHAHPGWGNYDPRLAHSVAKRAAGTLTAQWREVLAVSGKASSDSDAGCKDPHHASVRSQPLRSRGRVSHSFPARALLRSLHRRLSIMAGEARRAGETERLVALIDVLRLIAHEDELRRAKKRQ